MKRVLCAFLSIAVMLAMMPATVLALEGEPSGAEIIGSGNCGAAANGQIVTASNPATDTVTWTLYSDGLLKVEGNGAMADYEWNTTPFCNMTEIKDVVIGDGVTRIGTYAFFNCDHSMDTVSIPGSVKSIGHHAFRSSERLKTISIAEGVETIGRRVFEGCTSLQTITIPASVTAMGGPDEEYYTQGAFCKCTSLREVTFLNPETSINTHRMFWECYNLERVTLPQNYVMKNGMFYCCEKLKYINATEESDINFPADMTAIPQYSLEGMNSIEVLTIPEGVTSIGTEAFCESQFKVINLPKSLTTIATTSFRNCPKLETITIADGNTSFKVENHLLLNTEATDIYGVESAAISGDFAIPETVVNIPGRMFVGCENLTGIIIPATATNIDNVAFMRCSALEKIEVDPLNTEYKVENQLLINTAGTHVYLSEKADSYVIPDTVETINNHAFGSPLANLNFLGDTVPENLSTVIANSGTDMEHVSVKTGVFAVVNGIGYGTPADGGAENTIEEAFTAALHQNTPVTLYKNAELTDSITVGENQALVIDLNGHTLDRAGTQTIINHGELTIQSGTNKVPVENNGKVSYDAEVTIGDTVYTPETGKLLTIDAKENSVSSDGALTMQVGSEAPKTFKPAENGTVAIKDDSVTLTTETGIRYSGSISGNTVPSVGNGGEITLPAGSVITTANGDTMTVKEDVTIDSSHVHSWNAGTVTKAPTYQETGIRTYICTVCGETKEKSIDKLVWIPADNSSADKEDAAIQARTEAVRNTKITLRSQQVKLKTGRMAVKLTWKTDNDVELDGIEIFRSMKRYAGYGKTPRFSTDRNAYYNTAVKTGKKYYYKVRGYVTIAGEKIYTQYSTKAWRTVK
ncbi:MAG: leucine-rich repeat protein [Anaerovoracaceae bacterium]